MGSKEAHSTLLNTKMQRSLGVLRRAHALCPERSSPAGASVEALRRAYLDLLKLALCDLVGPSPLTVLATPEGGVISRELRGELRALRYIGFDWPYNGLSMAGLLRLDDLERCVATIVEEGIEGDLIEAGVWRGGAALLMRATLAAYGGDADRTVVLADSFQGFDRSSAGSTSGAKESRELEGFLKEYEYLAVPRAEVERTFERFGYTTGIEFVEGFFEDTLASLTGRRRWALLRLDGDTYSATRACLEALYDDLADGGFVIVDDYHLVDECRRAVDEFRAERGIEDEIVAVDWTCVRWRKGSGAASRSQPACVLDGAAEESEEDLDEAIASDERLRSILDPHHRGFALPPTPAIPTAHEAELAVRVRAYEEQLLSTEAWLRAAGQRAEALYDEIARLRERVAALEHACTSYETSLSWKITRPLRWLAARARRITGRVPT